MGGIGFNAVFDGLWAMNNRGKLYDEEAFSKQFKFFLDDDDEDEDEDDDDDE